MRSDLLRLAHKHSSVQALSSAQLTSTKECPLSPVHGQQDSSTQADTLRKVDAAPEIHSQQPAAKVQPVKVEDCSVANVGQATHVSVFKCFVHGLVNVAVIDLVQLHTRGCLAKLVQFAAEVCTLLVCALCRGGECGQLGVDLSEEFLQFAKVEGAALVLVVGFKQPVQALQVVGRLREAGSDALRYTSPVGVADGQLLGILALLPGKSAEERHNVLRDVVLDGRAVANGVDVAKRRTS